MGSTLSICVVVCLALYGGLEYSLRREIDAFLRGEVLEFISILEEEASAPLAKIEAEVRRELGSRLRGDLVFRMVSMDGRLVLTSAVNDAIPVPPDAGQQAEARRRVPRFLTVSIAGGEHDVRVCSQPTHFQDQAYLVQVAYSLDGMEHSLRQFREICGAAIGGAALLSLMAGRWLARRLLRPVRDMTDSAQLITATRLADRLVRSGSGDELDRLAETLNQMLDRLEAQFRQIQQFTADASHELRTPLAALRGSAELALSRERSAEELRQTVQASIERFDQLSRIAEDLLLLARLDTGDAVLRPEPVRLDAIIDDVIDLYDPYAAEQRVALRFEPRQAVWLRADNGRLRQVAGNLIDNAIRHMGRPGCVQVAVSSDDGWAVLKVADDGNGVPADDLPHLFGRFFRGERSRSATGRSSAGLGLAICKSLVEAHGGTIELVSTPGAGATVTIRLPGAGSAPPSG